MQVPQEPAPSCSPTVSKSRSAPTCPSLHPLAAPPSPQPRGPQGSLSAQPGPVASRPPLHACSVDLAVDTETKKDTQSRLLPLTGFILSGFQPTQHLVLAEVP